MSELNNPLFEDRREFLERQKEEYKNALLSDVADLKDQSQAIGKKLLIAGGFLAGIYLIGRAIGSSSEEKPKKKKKSNRLENAAKFKGAEDRAWISSIPELEDDEPLYSAIERTYPAVYHPGLGTTLTMPAQRQKEETSLLKSIVKSDLFKILEQQLAAMLMVYLTKLIEKQMSAHSQQPALQEVVTTEVVEYHLDPEQAPDAQPSQP